MRTTDPAPPTTTSPMRARTDPLFSTARRSSALTRTAPSPSPVLITVRSSPPNTKVSPAKSAVFVTRPRSPSWIERKPADPPLVDDDRIVPRPDRRLDAAQGAPRPVEQRQPVPGQQGEVNR